MTDKKSKLKYDAEYISYVERGESAAVFITRDIVNSIKTGGKWIDVSDIDGDKKILRVEIDVIETDDYGKDKLLMHHDDEQNWIERWNFKSFVVELFPRKTRPDYSNCITDEDYKYVTWETAHKDIIAQRRVGYVGPKFKIYTRLIVIHEGKFTYIDALWNEKTERWAASRDEADECIFKARKVFLPPEYTYHILKIERLNEKGKTGGKQSNAKSRAKQGGQSKATKQKGSTRTVT